MLVERVGNTGGSAGPTTGTGGETLFDGGLCQRACAPDQRSVIDCHGAVLASCGPTEVCDLVASTCVDACAAAVTSKQSVGCEYYATFMDQILPDVCFAAIVANTWTTPAHLQVEYQGVPLQVAAFTRIPSGSAACPSWG